MDARAALLDLCLSVDPLVRPGRTRLQRQARASQRRAMATLAPERAAAEGLSTRTDSTPDAEALVATYYSLGGTHEALVAAISRLRWIDAEDTRS